MERCEPGDRGFVSNIFPTIKKDGTARVILNLKELNNYVKHVHFKMDTVKDVISLIQPRYFFVSIDLKDAYFSVYVRPEDRKWLQFFGENQRFQFTCLPQGLTSAPRTFTKLMKPVLSHLRKLGMIVDCYLDDCLFMAASVEELKSNVRYALHLYDLLGLTINIQKSTLEPTKEIEFLGIILNSVEMTSIVTPRRKERIKVQGILLLKKK